MDLKTDSWSLGLYLQHIFKNSDLRHLWCQSNGIMTHGSGTIVLKFECDKETTIKIIVYRGGGIRIYSAKY